MENIRKESWQIKQEIKIKNINKQDGKLKERK